MADDPSKIELPIIWIMGGPGCGKGTQCELIQTKTGYTHVSTGDVLRHEVMSGSARGLKFYKTMEAGEPVPNDMMAELIREIMLSKVIGSKGFLMDGFPLDMEQALCFQRFIGIPTTILYLALDDEVMKDRLKKRGNFDDTEESVKRRVDTFNDKTKKLIGMWNAVKIDANKPAVEVFAQIEAALDKEKALNLCETVQMA